MYEEYERLKAELQALFPNGRELSLEEKIDWAYGNAVLSNPDVTREMVALAVAKRYNESHDDNQKAAAGSA